MRLRTFVITCTLAFALAPSAASADWLFTPFVGPTFGGAANGERVTFGGSAAWLGGRIVGFEVDFGYSPEFFENDDAEFPVIEGSNLTTLMGNIIASVPVGGQKASFRPYGSGGFGLIRSKVNDIDDFFDVSDTSFGFNLGGGAMAFITDTIAIHGDIRYFRSLQDAEEDDEFDFDASAFNFWRAMVGVTFRF